MNIVTKTAWVLMSIIVMIMSGCGGSDYNTTYDTSHSHDPSMYPRYLSYHGDSFKETHYHDASGYAHYFVEAGEELDPVIQKQHSHPSTMYTNEDASSIYSTRNTSSTYDKYSIGAYAYSYMLGRLYVAVNGNIAVCDSDNDGTFSKVCTTPPNYYHVLKNPLSMVVIFNSDNSEYLYILDYNSSSKSYSILESLTADDNPQPNPDVFSAPVPIEVNYAPTISKTNHQFTSMIKDDSDGKSLLLADALQGHGLYNVNPFVLHPALTEVMNLENDYYLNYGYFDQQYTKSYIAVAAKSGATEHAYIFMTKGSKDNISPNSVLQIRKGYGHHMQPMQLFVTGTSSYIFAVNGKNSFNGDEEYFGGLYYGNYDSNKSSNSFFYQSSSGEKSTTAYRTAFSETAGITYTTLANNWTDPERVYFGQNQGINGWVSYSGDEASASTFNLTTQTGKQINFMYNTLVRNVTTVFYFTSEENSIIGNCKMMYCQGGNNDCKNIDLGIQGWIPY